MLRGRIFSGFVKDWLLMPRKVNFVNEFGHLRIVPVLIGPY